MCKGCVNVGDRMNKVEQHVCVCVWGDSVQMSQMVCSSAVCAYVCMGGTLATPCKMWMGGRRNVAGGLGGGLAVVADCACGKGKGTYAAGLEGRMLRVAVGGRRWGMWAVAGKRVGGMGGGS